MIPINMSQVVGRQREVWPRWNKIWEGSSSWRVKGAIHCSTKYLWARVEVSDTSGVVVDTWNCAFWHVMSSHKHHRWHVLWAGESDFCTLPDHYHIILHIPSSNMFHSTCYCNLEQKDPCSIVTPSSCKSYHHQPTWSRIIGCNEGATFFIFFMKHIIQPSVLSLIRIFDQSYLCHPTQPHQHLQKWPKKENHNHPMHQLLCLNHDLSPFHQPWNQGALRHDSVDHHQVV